MQDALSTEQIARRAPLWVALSDLFLDTEMQAIHYQGILDAARAGGFQPDEVVAILNQEVAPVLRSNLLQIAGEWAMFDPDWVVSRVSAYLALKPAQRIVELPLTENGRRKFRQRWPRLERILRGEPIEHDESAPLRAGSINLNWGLLVLLLVATIAWCLFR